MGTPHVLAAQYQLEPWHIQASVVLLLASKEAFFYCSYHSVLEDKLTHGAKLLLYCIKQNNFSFLSSSVFYTVLSL